MLIVFNLIQLYFLEMLKDFSLQIDIIENLRDRMLFINN
jgi:hypothetical protein